MRRGKKIVDGLLNELEVTAITKCGVACSRDELCRSFNLCDDTRCQLSYEDVFSTQKADTILETGQNCIYVGMRKHASPKCRENGIFADIQEEISSNCKINSKRVDREWGPWETEKIDNIDEWKVSSTRSMLVDASHGGVEGDNSNEILSAWLKFNRENLPWLTAKSSCETFGGVLFSRLNGSVTQLEFLVKKMPQTTTDFIWLGGYTEDYQTWRSIDGVLFPNGTLKWDRHQPNRNGDQKCLAVTVKNAKLNDIWCDKEYPSVCDML